LDDWHLVKQFKVQLLMYMNSPQAVEYWQPRQSLEPHIWQLVDWDMLEKAYNLALLGCWQWASKYSSGHLAMGRLWSGGNF